MVGAGRAVSEAIRAALDPVRPGDLCCPRCDRRPTTTGTAVTGRGVDAPLVLDASEGLLALDATIAGYAHEEGRAIVIVVNKWDQVKEKGKRKFEEDLRDHFKFLDYAPIAFITAKEAKNVQVVLDLAKHLFNQANIRMTTGRLNAAVKQILQERTPSTPTGRKAKIFYASQIETSPPPSCRCRSSYRC